MSKSAFSKSDAINQQHTAPCNGVKVKSTYYDHINLNFAQYVIFSDEDFAASV